MKSLFPEAQPDGGPQDAGPDDAGPQDDAGTDAGTEVDEDPVSADSGAGTDQDLPKDETGGCGCSSGGGRCLWLVLVLMPLWVRKQT
jgi:hypothetical protein